MVTLERVQTAPGTAPQPVSATIPLQNAYARGLVSNGYVVGVSGRRDATGLFEIWSGDSPLRALPDIGVGAAGGPRPVAPGGVLTVVSDSGSDTDGGGGANAVLVSYIEGGSLYERFGIAATNGTTAAAVLQGEVVNGAPSVRFPPTPVTNAILATRASILSAAVSSPPRATNVGRISILVDGVPQHLIDSGEGKANGAFAFIPRGWVGDLTTIGVGTIAGGEGFDLSLVAQGAILVAPGLVITVPELTVVRHAFPAGQLWLPQNVSFRLGPLTHLRVVANNTGPSRLSSVNFTYTVIEDDSDRDPEPSLQPMRIQAGR